MRALAKHFKSAAREQTAGLLIASLAMTQAPVISSGQKDHGPFGQKDFSIFRTGRGSTA
jgi:hypothetical protein